MSGWVRAGVRKMAQSICVESHWREWNDASEGSSGEV
jgi:hypothetical protein